MNTLKRIVALIALTIAIPLLLYSQESQGNVFAFSTYKIRFDQLTEYLDLYEKESKPLVAQNEHVISQRIFTHLWGPDWTVLMVTEYKDFASIQESQKRGTELFEKKYPDKAKRDDISRKFQTFNLGHTDALVLERAKLRK